MRNSAILMLFGRVYSDPKMPSSRNPDFVVFGLTVYKKWKNKNGEEQKQTTWYECSTSAKGLSDIVKKYIKEKMDVYVQGVPKCHAYIDKEGNPKAHVSINITDINMLSFIEEETESSQTEKQSIQYSKISEEDTSRFDEIPF